MNTRIFLSLAVFVVGFQGGFLSAAESVPDKAKALAARAQDCANKSADARITAVNALKNALAAEDDAEQCLLKAMSTQGQDSSTIKTMKESFDKASADTVEAMRLVEKAIDFAAAAQRSAFAALAEAEKVQKNTGDEGAESGLEKGEDLMASALKSLKKAETVTSELKQVWLIPMLTTTTTTTSTTTTTVLPSPTPVGRR